MRFIFMKKEFMQNEYDAKKDRKNNNLKFKSISFSNDKWNPVDIWMSNLIM